MKLSYAQNFEDVVLWRVLGNVKQGFYIDVGANNHSIDSVTKIFYDSGWSGINIEPTPKSYNDLCKHRERDINIQKCASDKSGQKIEMLDVLSTGLSTSSVENQSKFVKQGYTVEHLNVETDTLNNIWADNGLSVVHFLKIDVEGMETEVLAGLDLHSYRPWVILVESIDPVTNLPNYVDWEKGLLDAQYEFVYFDGLNRFYLASEKIKLKSKFSNPPNILEDSLIQNVLHLTRFVYPVLLQDVERATQKRLELETSVNNLQLSNDDLRIEKDTLLKEKVSLQDLVNGLELDNAKLENSHVKLEKTHIKLEKTHIKLEKTHIKLEKEINILMSQQNYLQETNSELHNIHSEFISITSSKIWKCTLPIRKLSIYIYYIISKFRIFLNYYQVNGLHKTILKIKQVYIKPTKPIKVDKYKFTENEKKIFNDLKGYKG